MGFTIKQAEPDRVFAGLALIAAQRKAVSIAEIARAVPILAPDNFLIPCLGVSVPAVRLSSDELDRFIESLHARQLRSLKSFSDRKMMKT